MICMRCGFPRKLGETIYDHTTCDEFEVDQNETWSTPEEKTLRSEVLARRALPLNQWESEFDSRLGEFVKDLVSSEAKIYRKGKNI